MQASDLAEAGLVPDFLARWGIRRMVAERLREIRAVAPDEQEAAERRWAQELRESPIALVPDLANQQHYEVEPEFFRLVLGPRLKYSCSLYETGAESLEVAEERMLDLTFEHAQIEDGMRILDLGCGWGSTALTAASRFPGSRVVAVSNSKLQREFILNRAHEAGLANLDAITADINGFEATERFDRVVSVEMFEHVRNYEALMRRISGWLTPTGKLFVHIFSHRSRSYPYEDRGPGDWMARNFFSGGQMPSHDLLLRFQDALKLEERWRLDGTHYQRTAEDWLANLDANRFEVVRSLARTYGEDQATVWMRRWRLFFLGCAETFGAEAGAEWGVSHYRFGRVDAAR